MYCFKTILSKYKDKIKLSKSNYFFDCYYYKDDEILFSENSIKLAKLALIRLEEKEKELVEIKKKTDKYIKLCQTISEDKKEAIKKEVINLMNLEWKAEKKIGKLAIQINNFLFKKILPLSSESISFELQSYKSEVYDEPIRCSSNIYDISFDKTPKLTNISSEIYYLADRENSDSQESFLYTDLKKTDLLIESPLTRYKPSKTRSESITKEKSPTAQSSFLI